MNRNRHPIRSTDQIINAMRSVDQITKALKLPKVNFDDMYVMDVVNQIDNDLSADDKAHLASFADGMYQAYLSILLTEHCEFVFLIDGVTLSVKEVARQGAGGREGNVCGFQWRDTADNFTEFQKEIPSWI